MTVIRVENEPQPHHQHANQPSPTIRPNNYSKSNESKGTNIDEKFRKQYSNVLNNIILFQLFSCKDYYEVLKVSKDATDSEIKKSYKKLALVLHPGKLSIFNMFWKNFIVKIHIMNTYFIQI